MEDLEKSLTETNRGIHELETRVSELEFSTQYMESRPSTDNGMKKNLKEHIKSETNSVEYLRNESTTPVIQSWSVQNNTTENEEKSGNDENDEKHSKRFFPG